MLKIHKVAFVLSIIGSLSSVAIAEAATGFLKGETTEGFNKVCYYDVLGDTHTKNVSSVSICPLSISVNRSIQPTLIQKPKSYGSPLGNQIIQPQSFSTKKTGFLSGERSSGFNKICFYDVLGTTYTLNKSSVSICPLTAKF